MLKMRYFQDVSERHPYKTNEPTLSCSGEYIQLKSDLNGKQFKKKINPGEYIKTHSHCKRILNYKERRTLAYKFYNWVYVS